MHSLPPSAALLASVSVCYQPVVRLSDAHIEYAEVLVRARGDDGKILGPETIIDAMTGAQRSLDLSAAIICEALANHHTHGFAAIALPLAVNLPLDALLHPDLPARLAMLCSTANVAPALLRLELTETQPVHDLAAASAVIGALREAGHTLALDDITPDMPYLDALLDLPISAVKLDRSVVVPPNEAFINAVVARCAPRGVAIVAEGIETAPLATRMAELGATHGQGFLFARPLSAAGLRAFLHPG